MLQRLTLLTVPIIALLSTSGIAQSGGGIGGRWRTDDGNAIIHVAPCAANARQWCGRIVQMTNPTLARATDSNNPDAALRSRPLVGVPVLSNLVASGQRYSGSGYSPEEGRNFTATVTPNGSRLTVRGCVAIFCRTVVWTRAQ